MVSDALLQPPLPPPFLWLRNVSIAYLSCNTPYALWGWDSLLFLEFFTNCHEGAWLITALVFECLYKLLFLCILHSFYAQYFFFLSHPQCVQLIFHHNHHLHYGLIGRVVMICNLIQSLVFISLILSCLCILITFMSIPMYIVWKFHVHEFLSGSEWEFSF